MPNTVLGKVSVVPRGDYSASTTYYALDIVGYNGGSYLAMKESTGVTPSNDQVNWMQLSGPGLPGVDGVTFTPSVSEAGVISWTNDGEEENPDPVDIMGPPGAAAGFGTVTATADNTSSETPSVDVQSSGPDTARNFTFAFSGLKGKPGDTPDIEIGTVTTLEPDQDATADITGTTPNLSLSLGIPKGQPGTSVSRIQRTSGTGAAGTTDTYTMYDSNDDAIGTFTVYNGANGAGAGDLMADGSVPMTGPLNMGGNKITNLAEPTDNTDAASKEYVDDTITVSLVGNYIPTGQKGQANGVASLDGSGKVPNEQLPPMDYVPTSRTVNGHALSADVTLDAEDVGAIPNPTGGTAGQVLTKTADGSAWENAPSGLPDGGAEGQMLYKAADGAAWGDKPVMYVNITMTSGTAGTSDKTSSEINDAVEKGYAVYANLEDAVVIPLASKGQSVSVFSISRNNNSRAGITTFAVDALGSVSVVETELAVLDSDGKIPYAQLPDMDYVPTSRTVNGQALSQNITLDAEDVGAMPPPTRLTVTLNSSSWSGNSQTITVNGVITNTSAQDIDISCADKASADAWAAGGVWCSNPTQANRLTFTCTTQPTANINLNIRLWEVG